MDYTRFAENLERLSREVASAADELEVRAAEIQGETESLKARESAIRHRIVADFGLLLAGAIRESLQDGA